jgi:hypothetical protein
MRIMGDVGNELTGGKRKREQESTREDEKREL